jgi:hypothetical protein
MSSMNNIRWILFWSFSQTATLFAIAVPGAMLFGATGVAAGLLISEIVGSFIIPLSWVYRDLRPAEREGFWRDQVLATITPIVGTTSLLLLYSTAGAGKSSLLIGGTALCLAALWIQLRRIPASTRAQVVQTIWRMFRRDSKPTATRPTHDAD